MPIRILIADDHRILRAGLKSLMNFEENLEVVGEVTSGLEVIESVQSLNPDIVLMDIGMPGNENLEALKQTVNISPKTRVLILTMHEDLAVMQECLLLGASGYIIKRAAESELIDAINAVHKGIIYVHPSLMRALVEVQSKRSRQVTPDPDQLTPREIEILRYIVQGYNNRQIADELQISVRTVETHRANLMEKLNLHNRLDLIRYANQHKLGQ